MGRVDHAHLLTGRRVERDADWMLEAADGRDAISGQEPVRLGRAYASRGEQDIAAGPWWSRGRRPRQSPSPGRPGRDALGCDIRRTAIGGQPSGTPVT